MIENYLNKAMIAPDLSATTKPEALKELAGLISSFMTNVPSEEIEKALVEREHIDSTGIEKGIAIPHAKIDGLGHLVIAVGRSKKGINFDSHDKGNTHLFFVMLAPSKAADEHMKALARLAKLLTSQGLREKLLEAKDADVIYRLLMDADKKLC